MINFTTNRLAPSLNDLSLSKVNGINAVAELFKAFASNAEGRVFEDHARQLLMIYH